MTPSPSVLSAPSSPRAAQLQRQVAAIRSSDRMLQQQAAVHAIHSSPVAQARREFFSKAQGAPLQGKTAVAQREPEAVPVKPDERPVYHITTLENFQQIVARGGLVPLNWIIEGTHGQKRDPGSMSKGLDAARGASKHETPEDHAGMVRKISEAWKQSTDADEKKALAKRFADFKLGRKSDFVYGTKGGGTLASYRDFYQGNKVPIESLVVLRWVQAREAYYPDLEDSGAIKTLEGIPLGRLQVTQAIGIGDGRPDVLEGLPWLPAGNLDLLVKAGLLPPPPPRVAPREPEEDPLPSIEDLEGQIQQDEEADDAWLQQLEDELAQEDLQDGLLIAELEDSIEREGAEDDQLIAELEKELGPGVVAQIERELRKELQGEMEESARIDRMVARVLQETAPLLEQANSIEEQLQIAMDEAQELVDQSNQVSDLLARPLE
jgi:hypothetical protein